MRRDDLNEVKTKLFKPHPFLSPWIKNYLLLEPKKVPDDPHFWTIMPDGSSYLIFHLYKNRSRLSIVGPRSISINIDRKSRKLTFIVQFKPGSLSALTELPIVELRDQSIPLESIWDKEASDRLQFQLNAALEKRDISRCIKSVEQELYLRLINMRKPNNLLEKSIQLIDSSKGGKRITDITSQLTISDRNLRYLFDKHVGITPKRYARISRVLSVIKRVDSGITNNWSELAFDSNYYDQAHLIGDFNLLLGESPTRFVSRPNREEVV